MEAAGRVRTSPGRRAPEAELLLDVLDGLGGLRDGLQRVLNHVDVAWLGVCVSAELLCSTQVKVCAFRLASGELRVQMAMR